jgi:transcriptional regulator with XRE-family HTH domain
MLKNTISMLRRAWGLSQQKFGKDVGLTGAYISALELGKNENMSFPSIQLIVQTYKCDKDWLLTGAINQNYLREIHGTFLLNPEITLDAVAKRLEVPVSFLQAIKGGEISPSTEFFERIMRAIGVEPQGDFDDRVRSRLESKGTRDTTDAARLREEIVELKEKLRRAERTIDYLMNELEKKR